MLVQQGVLLMLVQAVLVLLVVAIERLHFGILPTYDA